MKQKPQEEFNDWPYRLLATGTFGNKDLKQNLELCQNISQQQDPFDIQEEPSASSGELQEFTSEEVGKLQKKLTKLLSRKPTSDVEKELANLPLDKFLNCPSSLEMDKRISNALYSDSADHREED
ncbi:hypothetical protein PTKIN_Ptkin07bG0058100 [Pterospermum kingtungense]